MLTANGMKMIARESFKKRFKEHISAIESLYATRHEKDIENILTHWAKKGETSCKVSVQAYLSEVNAALPADNQMTMDEYCNFLIRKLRDEGYSVTRDGSVVLTISWESPLW